MTLRHQTVRHTRFQTAASFTSCVAFAVLLSLLLSTLSLVVLSAGDAHAETEETFSASVEGMPGDMTQPLTIPQIDQANATVTEIRVEYTTTALYQLRLENSSPAPVAEDQFAGSVSVGAGVVLPGFFDTFEFEQLDGAGLAGFDGLLDFVGPSGRTVAGDIGESEMVRYMLGEPGFQNFVGTGNVPGLSCRTREITTLTGPAGLVLGARVVRAACEVTVTYEYLETPTPTCNGKFITTRFETLFQDVDGTVQGTEGDDVVNLTNGDDRFNARGGDDTICALDGNDVVIGDNGDDVIFGGDGQDLIVGRLGNDTIDGGPGFDVLNGGSGDDRLFGRQGDDRLEGLDGHDVLHGNRGDDTILGGNGDDRIFGYAGNDQIFGEEGNDRLHGNFGDDEIEGGPGNDRIFGYGDDDLLSGGEGDDLLGGNFGNDGMQGGPGNDTMYGSDGNDVVSGGEGNDVVSGNSGDDRVQGNAGNDTLDGGINVDLCEGGPGIDTATRCENVFDVP